MNIVMLTIFFGMRDTKYMNIIHHFFPDSTAIRQFTNIKLATLLVCINTSTFTTQLSCQKNSNLAIVENTKTETETYLKSSQTTKMELFAKIVNGWKLLTIFTKRSILVFWYCFEYVHEICSNVALKTSELRRYRSRIRTHLVKCPAHYSSIYSSILFIILNR